MALSLIFEERSISLTDVIIFLIHSLVYFIAHFRAAAHISVPILRPLFLFIRQLGYALCCPHWGARPCGQLGRGPGPAASPATGPSNVDSTSGADNRARGPPNSARAHLNKSVNETRKRKRKDDDEKRNPGKIKKSIATAIPSLVFACPCYLHDRHGNRTCLRDITLKRIVDVRQHLTRAHLLDAQCPTCGQEFKGDTGEDLCNAHIRLQACQPLPSPLPVRHGITIEQWGQIHAIGADRTVRRVADPAAEKWFEIWDIIYPTTTRPQSPYITDHSDVQRISDMNNIIFNSELWRELRRPTQESNPFLEQASRSVFMAIAERFMAIYRRLYEGPGGPATEAEELPAVTTPVASSVGRSLHQRRGWELLSAPSQFAAAIEVQMLAQRDNRLAPTASHGSWNSRPTQGNPLPLGRLNYDALAPTGRSLPPLAPGPDFLEDPQFQDMEMLMSMSYGDFRDQFGPAAQVASPSQFLNDEYEADMYSSWVHPGEDNLDADGNQTN